MYGKEYLEELEKAPQEKWYMGYNWIESFHDSESLLDEYNKALVSSTGIPTFHRTSVTSGPWGEGFILSRIPNRY